MSSVRAFETKFTRMMNGLRESYPSNVDVATMHEAALRCLALDPATFMRAWAADMVPRFAERLAAGDVGFFLTKDFHEEIHGAGVDAATAAVILAQIERLRDLVRTMPADKQTAIVKELSVLCTLSVK